MSLANDLEAAAKKIREISHQLRVQGHVMESQDLETQGRKIGEAARKVRDLENASA